MNETQGMPRRISAEEELAFIRANRKQLRTHFLTPAKKRWAHDWGHSESEFEEIVTTVLSMDEEQIVALRAENRGKNPLEGERETQLQLLHSIDLFITGVLNFSKK